MASYAWRHTLDHQRICPKFSEGRPVVKSVVAVNLTTLLVLWDAPAAPVGLSGYCIELKDQLCDWDAPLATITVPTVQNQCVISGVDLQSSRIELRVGYAFGNPPLPGAWSVPTDATVAPAAPAVPVVKMLLPSDQNSLRIEWSSPSAVTPAVSAYEVSVALSGPLESEALLVVWLGIPDDLALLPRTERAAFYNRNLVLVEQPRAGLGGDDGFNGEGNLFSRFGKRVPIYSGTSPGHALLLLAHSDALVSS